MTQYSSGYQKNANRATDGVTKYTPTRPTILTTAVVIITAMRTHWATAPEASVRTGFFTHRTGWRWRWWRRRRTTYPRFRTGIRIKTRTEQFTEPARATGIV